MASAIKKPEQVLDEVETLIGKNLMEAANAELENLLSSIPAPEIVIFRSKIEELIRRFHPKRRKKLSQFLEELLNPGSTEDLRQRPLAGRTSVSFSAQAKLSELQGDIGARLATLSKAHIFQWGTHYREELLTIANKAIRAETSVDLEGQVSPKLLDLVMEHSAEIFGKGYRHLLGSRSMGDQALEAKSTGGLRSFIEVAVDTYATVTIQAITQRDIRASRDICSAIIAGIVRGFANSEIPKDSSVVWLGRSFRHWGYAAFLLTPKDLQCVFEVVSGVELKDVRRYAEVFSVALSRLYSAAQSTGGAVSSAQLFVDQRKVDVVLRPPVYRSEKGPIQVRMHLGEVPPPVRIIDEAVREGVSAFICTLDAGGRSSVALTRGLRDKTVDLSAQMAENRLAEILEFEFSERRDSQVGGGPISLNIAAQFPLNNPRLLSFFRVARPSVRALSNVIEFRSGALLWCSVRRSGKTTAIGDIAGATQRTRVVVQTCASSDPNPESRLFFSEAVEALRQGRYLPEGFVTDVVGRAGAAFPAAGKSVLILDEYERLFATLAAAGKRDPEVRYLVVQPLLDQLSAFSRENLLVLTGQQPDAHFIFMDQNQLSPYIRQDEFPLFGHQVGESGDEFHSLLFKVLTSKLPFEPSFADAAFMETAGHPFLTVNMLVDFVDWLILKRYRPSETRLDSEIFAEFSAVRLRESRFAVSGAYAFFLAAAREALTENSKKVTPWLHAVYRVLQDLGSRGDKDDPSLPYSEVRDIAAAALRGGDATLYGPDELIASGARSNFFLIEGEAVRPRIRLLCRLTAAAV